MKSIKVLAVLALLVFSTSVSAQQRSTAARTAAAKKTTSSIKQDGWSEFYFQWNPSTFKYDGKGADDQDFTGLSVGYSKVMSIMETSPLYLEVGGALQYSFYSEDLDDYYGGYDYDDYYYYYYSRPTRSSDDDHEMKWYMVSLKVPVNLMYEFEASDAVSIVPFGGLTARFNLFGSYKYGDSDSVDLFDKKKMGNNPVKRFQIGWQIGCNVMFNNKWYLGASYGSDFSEVQKKTKISTTTVQVGFVL